MSKFNGMNSYIHSPEELEAAASALLKAYPNNADLPMKERTKLPKQYPPTLDPVERATCQDEVEKSLTPAQAVMEARRCLQCKNHPCVEGCPVNVNIPEFMHLTAEGDFDGAIEAIRRSSLLPAICGRVCPQERQCQRNCTVGKTKKDVFQSVGIGKVERFLADYARESGRSKIPEVAPETGKRVAVVGSGPAGLACAADCRRAGHKVTIFEALHKLGGVMRYGIPEFRLPNKVIDAELDTLAAMGVEFRTNFVVGRTRPLLDLLEKDGFDAAFVGTGAGLPLFTNIPGEGFVGVFAANEYLTRANLMGGINGDAVDTPVFPSRKAIVLGGGNVAMDACRMAKRLGAEEVHVLYRRGREEMPARAEEVAHAMEEGVDFRFLENAIEVLGDEKGRVRGVVVQRYELGEPDASGRRSPVAIPGDTYELEADMVVVAIGNGSNPLITATTPGLEANKRGNIIVEEGTNKTSVDGVYAGGDIVLGAATVILAMGEGKRAAKAINAKLAGG